MRTFFIFALMVSIVPFRLAAQQSLKSDKTKSSITYFMKHALHAFSGTSKDVSCIIQLNSQGDIEKVAATAKVKSFDSQNSNRDSHMMETTDALTYPSVSFYSTSMTKSANGYAVKGVLNFHGVEKPISMEAKETRTGSQRTVTGNFIFLLEDYKVERPTLFMVKTENEVKIEFLFAF